jgi:C4-type Zn-finger protein
MSNQSSMQILCPKCHQIKPATKHHLLPVRFFGENPLYLWICRSCHDLLEDVIPRHQVLSEDEYIELAVNFLQEVPSHAMCKMQ